MLYLLFYPLAYVAVVKSLQKALGRLARPNWLDGVVAGLGAAALCAAFAFHSIHHLTGGTALSAAVNLAYPVGDLLILLLVIGGTVLLAGRGSRQWYLQAAGLLVIVVGDTFNLVGSSGLATRFGNDVNAFAWPTAIFLISMSVWLPERRLDPLREQKVSSFFLPGVAAAAGLFILVAGTVHSISRVALWLAVATPVSYTHLLCGDVSIPLATTPVKDGVFAGNEILVDSATKLLAELAVFAPLLQPLRH